MKPSNASKRKSYRPPTLRRITLDQAKLFLVGHAYVGDKGAKKLLELLFPEPGGPKRPGNGEDPNIPGTLWRAVSDLIKRATNSLAIESAYCTGAFNAATSSRKLLAFTARSTASLRLNSSLASPSKSRCD